MKKQRRKILFGAFFITFLMIMMPAINILNAEVIKNNNGNINNIADTSDIEKIKEKIFVSSEKIQKIFNSLTMSVLDILILICKVFKVFFSILATISGVLGQKELGQIFLTISVAFKVIGKILELIRDTDWDKVIDLINQIWDKILEFINNIIDNLFLSKNYKPEMMSIL